MEARDAAPVKIAAAIGKLFDACMDSDGARPCVIITQRDRPTVVFASPAGRSTIDLDLIAPIHSRLSTATYNTLTTFYPIERPSATGHGKAKVVRFPLPKCTEEDGVTRHTYEHYMLIPPDVLEQHLDKRRKLDVEPEDEGAEAPLLAKPSASCPQLQASAAAPAPPPPTTAIASSSMPTYRSRAERTPEEAAREQFIARLRAAQKVPYHGSVAEMEQLIVDGDCQ